MASKRIVRIVLSAVSIVAGAACLAIAGLGIWVYLQNTEKNITMPSAEIVTETTDTPSEKSPGLVRDEYVVPANHPRAISIPKLSTDAYVQSVGVDQTNTMIAPNNIYYTGWYTGSVAPGEVGVSIINGHAGGRYENGVFKYIVQLAVGDSIRVQMGNHRWRDFTVVSATAYTVADAKQALFKDDESIEHELHLITCDGGFNDQTQTYDKRFIVVAKG